MKDRIRILGIINCFLLVIYIITTISISIIFDFNIIANKITIIIFVIMVLALIILAMAYQILENIGIKDKFDYREYLLDELNPSKTNEESNKDKKENKDEIENDDVDKNNTVITEKLEKKDIIALMLKNNDETKEYFKISKNQAKSSFWFSIIACIVGIVMIGISLYGVFKMKDTQFVIIGIVGGAVTELIAGTVLVIHNKSALQLNYYYDALHENEKFLSAINLADKLEDDDKRSMYIEIIRAQIQTANVCKREEQKWQK